MALVFRVHIAKENTIPKMPTVCFHHDQPRAKHKMDTTLPSIIYPGRDIFGKQKVITIQTQFVEVITHSCTSILTFNHQNHPGGNLITTVTTWTKNSSFPAGQNSQTLDIRCNYVSFPRRTCPHLSLLCKRSRSIKSQRKKRQEEEWI